MTCWRCGGTYVVSFGEVSCLACGSAPEQPAIGDGLAGLLPASLAGRVAQVRGRRQTVDEDDIAAIRERVAATGWGGKEALYREIAEQYGLSPVYVKQLALSHRRG